MIDELQKKPVVLAVDDAADTLGMLSSVLEAAGMTTLVAADGAGALSLLDNIVPDLVLMDALMPRMDGFETTRAIKANARFAHIPVIFMTGLSDTENVVKGFDAGGVDYITKPIVPEVMLARVRRHLDNARLSQGARHALDASGTPLMAANAQGEILWITPAGLKLLDETTSNWRERLMPVLPALIAGQKGSAAAPEVRLGPIQATLIGVSQQGEYLVRLKDADTPSEAAVLKRVLFLTDREAEVLVWLAKGKSNRDIASILDCSPRTVNKHLEQVFSKLQVENRTAAAMRAVQILSQH